VALDAAAPGDAGDRGPEFTMQYNVAGGGRARELKFARPLERFRNAKVELQEGIVGTDKQPLAPWALTFTSAGPDTPRQPTHYRMSAEPRSPADADDQLIALIEPHARGFELAATRMLTWTGRMTARLPHRPRVPPWIATGTNRRAGLDGHDEAALLERQHLLGSRLRVPSGKMRNEWPAPERLGTVRWRASAPFFADRSGYPRDRNERTKRPAPAAESGSISCL